MSFFRPEARATLHRWRDVIAGLGAAVIGLWWLVAAQGFLVWLGGLLAAAGLVFALAGFQRARFPRPGQGPGIVVLREGAVGYFGPLEGGVRSIDDIEAVILDPTARPPSWIISCRGQPDLAVPLEAKDADQLFDVFATLPGIRTERMLAEIERQSSGPVVIWRRPERLLH